MSQSFIALFNLVISDERYAAMKTSFMYNCLGFSTNAGTRLEESTGGNSKQEDNNSTPSLDNEDDSHWKTDEEEETSLNVASALIPAKSHLNRSELAAIGLYHLTAHLKHACVPNARVKLPTESGSNEISVYALKSIRKGEEITMEFVPCEGKAYLERVLSLQTAYQYKCDCLNCSNYE